MKLLVVGSIVSALALGAAQDDQEALIKKRDEKLANGWVKSSPWIPDYDKAREDAKEKNRLIFAYFTRSYAY